jgi:lysophospholipase L1-like esterase
MSATGGGEQRPPTTAAGPVLVIGDSLTVGAEPYLREALASREPTIDARTGRPSSEGVEVLSSLISPEYAVVVFDLGTNDDPAAPEALAANLEAARSIAGRRCLVVSTINRPPLNGVSDEGLNAAVDRFAAAGPRVQVADWRGAVAAEPSLLAADGVHAVPEGYATRAELVARAVDACAITQAPPAAAEAPPQPDPEPRPQRRPRPAADRQDPGLGSLWLFLLGLAAALLPG